MAFVSVEVDIEEFDDDDLIEEIESRGYVVAEDDDNDDKNPFSTGFPEAYSIRRNFNNIELREHLLAITDLGHSVSNEYLINQLKHML